MRPSRVLLIVCARDDCLQILLWPPSNAHTACSSMRYCCSCTVPTSSKNVFPLYGFDTVQPTNQPIPHTGNQHMLSPCMAMWSHAPQQTHHPYPNKPITYTPTNPSPTPVHPSLWCVQSHQQGAVLWHCQADSGTTGRQCLQHHGQGHP